MLSELPQRHGTSGYILSGYILSGYILSGYILSGYILFDSKKSGFSRYLGITQQAYANSS
jgi:hypothetical protein